MNDAVALLGFAAMVCGITVRYGWDVSLIIGGTTLLTLAVIGALRK